MSNSQRELLRQVGYGNKTYVSSAISDGATLNFIDGCDYCHDLSLKITPLELAIYMRHDIEYIEWLIEHGADVNYKSALGTSALEVCLRYGSEEYLRFLLDKGLKVKYGRKAR